MKNIQLNFKMGLLFEYSSHRYQWNIVRKLLKSTFSLFEQTFKIWKQKAIPKGIEKMNSALKRSILLIAFKISENDDWYFLFKSWVLCIYVYWLNSYKKSKWGYYRILNIFCINKWIEVEWIFRWKNLQNSVVPSLWSIVTFQPVDLEKLGTFKDEVSDTIFWNFLFSWELSYVLKSYYEWCLSDKYTKSNGNFKFSCQTVSDRL